MRQIIELAKETAGKYGGANVFETAENAGVKVWFRKLGSLKGFYLYENGVRYIVINEELDESMKTVVCAHELGHDQLHRELSGGKIRETTLFLENSKTEREANLFAASLLISDNDILSELEDESSLDVLAARLGYPREIIAYKLKALNLEGFEFNISDIKHDFLKE
ncbi:MAG: ImmA/IrrE family metallo-endopeptidase [Oscillospiraceae bacterium]|nr:ImmA/IrrE family metallo-endopeptidase [Oscillospiraceae bacterium]